MSLEPTKVRMDGEIETVDKPQSNLSLSSLQLILQPYGVAPHDHNGVGVRNPHIPGHTYIHACTA